MSGAYDVGDHVLILGKVVKAWGADIGYTVELFSKTDQYTAMIRPDLVVAKTADPTPPEPDREYLVVDQDGDIWSWSHDARAWECRSESGQLVWAELVKTFGPVSVYGSIS